MTHACTPADREQARHLAALLDADDVDAALDAGLMDFTACENCDAGGAGKIRAAQATLQTVWAARERYRAREARLQRIAGERAARRAPAQVQKTGALPASAAAILERAKAKAAQCSQQ